jgi:ABC-type bacteriocin/lantibiotic exporter with double-glycine peptidase domain
LCLFAILSIVTCVLPGCISPLTFSTSEAKLIASDEHIIVAGIDVPKVRGVDGCGAQALAAILAFHDPEIDAAELGEALPWHDEGATPVHLLLEARRHGREATIVRGSIDDLREEVRAGRPALVMIDTAPEVRTLFSRIPTTPVMHWAVVSGVALDGTRVLLAAPGARHHVIERADFERRWTRSDCCLIQVRPPQRR